MNKAVRFIIKWLIVFFAASILIFLLVRMMPTTPAVKWLDTLHLPRTEANIEWITHRMGLDRPLAVQYGIWMRNFFRGDWGVSLVSGEDIRARFFAKMPYSFSIGISGILIGSAAAFFLGFRAALRRGGICDKITTVLTIFSQSVPMFILSIIIINALGVRLRIARFFTGDGKYAMLAAILLTAFYSVGSLSRIVRQGFREEMGKSYVKFAVSRGFSKETVLFQHAYKPVLAGLISAVISHFAYVFGGSTVLEFAFTIPGLSTMLVSAMDSRDYNILQVYILVVVIWMFFVHLVLNLVLRALNVRGQES